MRRFVLYSREGYTAPFRESLLKAGRLDTVYQCILTSMFTSHAIRRENEFHAFLYGRPNPPLHLSIDGRSLFDVRVDEDTWRRIILSVLSGKKHPGVNVKKEGIETYAESLEEIYVLSENGIDIDEINFRESPTFFLGDSVGLPKKFEDLLLRLGGKKVSLGKKRYLAASTIDIVNYTLDKKQLS
ncbi:hypothetical protein IHE51_01560 [Candidatus Parvarchaeota archaeon]|uniref:tRNA (pseudouridine(54)-N(1))-methyltransferase n=1 Tax=Candidatus Acidifodinimicrobium mancum TaxID=2898728 RepID=A0A8T3URA4_9ARCH|nr:hypothetical protein [Candidatus Acidifodinimicrobium mancum]MBE5728525.1 hypothetical protein [Candidatus Acidifodinimicrobium mancum]MBE5728853.1 hypothetical protein [Candidatus Acidifodinimicrobium mancum]MBE5730119.1 hypothetical protein [Candidatus Acidifodinimicrobium mancum]